MAMKKKVECSRAEYAELVIPNRPCSSTEYTVGVRNAAGVARWSCADVFGKNGDWIASYTRNNWNGKTEYFRVVES